MQIEAVHCNAINGDGTLLLKIDVDEPEKPLQYCFYIYKGSQTLYKSGYSQKDWLEFKVDDLGKYQIKAFVRDKESGEKYESVVSYILKPKYAWKLAEAKNTEPELSGNIRVNCKKLSPGVIWAEADISGGYYAWQVFREGVERPEFKRNFSKDMVLVYAVLASGRYRVELTAEIQGKRLRGISDGIELEREELDCTEG